MEKITTLALLIALITGIACTLIVVIDWHKQNKLIQKILEVKND